MTAGEEEGTQRAMVLDPAGKIAGEVEALLGELGGWDVLTGPEEWAGSPAAVKEGKPAVVFVNLDAGLEEALETAAGIANLSPQSALLGVSEMERDRGGEWMIRGVRSGFRDFLGFPL
ncbi:MAG: hypothetical protein ACE5LX_06675, partial [Nitrospinota bacterium]